MGLHSLTLPLRGGAGVFGRSCLPTNTSVRPTPPRPEHMGLPLAGSTVQGRAFAWLLTCKVLSNKEWDDFRAAQGQPPLGVLGVLDAKSPIAVKDTSWEGLCPQQCPQKSGPKTSNVTDESKASAAHPHRHRHKVPAPKSAFIKSVAERSHTVTVLLPKCRILGFPQTESKSLEADSESLHFYLPPRGKMSPCNVWRPFTKGLCEATLGPWGPVSLFSQSHSEQSSPGPQVRK